MILRLENEKISIEIDTNGAYINSFSYGGKDIFFKRKTLDYKGVKKERGGCHPCIPQFSSGGQMNLPSHGYGRCVNWDLVDKNSKEIRLAAFGNVSPYKELKSTISYYIVNEEFHIELVMENLGDKPCPISPAFHPYFNIDQEEILIDGKITDSRSLKFEDTVFINDVKNLKTKDYSVKFNNTNLPVYALWTDRKEGYFCIEPTYNSNSFERKEGYLILKPGEKEIFKCSFKIV